MQEKVPLLKKELTWLPRLSPHLPCAIPTPTYVGRPDVGYPFPRALFTWIEGEEVASAPVTDWARNGQDLAGFVRSLHEIDLMGATRSGDLSWYRGGDLLPDEDWAGPCFDAARRHRPGVDLDVLGEVWQKALDLPPNGRTARLAARGPQAHQRARQGRQIPRCHRLRSVVGRPP